jgi:hypothetical protein
MRYERARRSIIAITNKLCGIAAASLEAVESNHFVKPIKPIVSPYLEGVADATIGFKPKLAFCNKIGEVCDVNGIVPPVWLIPINALISEVSTIHCFVRFSIQNVKGGVF